MSYSVKNEFIIPGFNSSAIRCRTIVSGQDTPYKQILSDAEVNSDFKCGRYILQDGQFEEFGWFNSIENARIVSMEVAKRMGGPYCIFSIFDKATDDLVEYCGYIGGGPMSKVDGVGYRCNSNGTLARGKMYSVGPLERRC